MTLRPRSLAFAGGFYVFPGGSVDAEDASVPVPRLPAGFTDAHGGSGVVAAAVREVFEEVGLLLSYDAHGRPLWIDEAEGGAADARRLAPAREALLRGEISLADLLRRYGWRIASDRLCFIGRWVTPPRFQRRYDTRFFLADVSGAVEPTPYAGEIEKARWMPLDEMLRGIEDPLAARRRGEKAPPKPEGDLPLMPPTYGTLHGLACHGDVDRAMAFFESPSRPRVLVGHPGTDDSLAPGTVPVALFGDDGPASSLDVALASVGIHRIPVTSPTLDPWAETNVYLIVSGGEGLLVDAGAGGADGARRMRVAWQRAGRPRLKALALTHAHPDHSLGAPDVLQQLGPLPLWAHPLEAPTLARYVPLAIDRELSGGETIRVGDVDVQVLHTPGHARGHLCFWLPAYGVLLAGDMVIADGSVWVGPPDGDLIAFLDAIRRLMDLPVRIAAPSHGPPFADAADHFRQLIRRRLKREEEIVALLRRSPADVDALLEAIYGDSIPEGVVWVARRTVQGHLDKLVREGRVEEAEGRSGLYRLVP